MPETTEKPREVLREVERGRSERTPWLALSGVTIVLGALFAVVVAIALIAYFLA